ncbi:MAG: EAL domain-containing protein [Clostridium sp.]|nr:MAG: EAL domain-containing protein [Clostridium sp.]
MSFYQPIYDATKERYTQIEALVRLKDDKRLGYISPEEFIPLAEREGLIGQIGDIVFANVCNFINESKEQISSIDTVSINISAGSMY